MSDLSGDVPPKPVRKRRRVKQSVGWRSGWQGKHETIGNERGRFLPARSAKICWAVRGGSRKLRG
jgi:hypothetical protein